MFVGIANSFLAPPATASARALTISSASTETAHATRLRSLSRLRRFPPCKPSRFRSKTPWLLGPLFLPRHPTSHPHRLPWRPFARHLHFALPIILLSLILQRRFVCSSSKGPICPRNGFTLPLGATRPRSLPPISTALPALPIPLRPIPHLHASPLSNRSPSPPLLLPRRAICFRSKTSTAPRGFSVRASATASLKW